MKKEETWSSQRRGNAETNLGKMQTYPRAESGSEASPSTEDSRNTNDQLSNGSAECDRIGNEQPPCRFRVRIQACLQRLGQQIIVLSIQAPDLHWIKPELGLARGASGNLVVSVYVVPVAVVPQTYDIEIMNVTRGISLLQSLCKRIEIVGDI